MIGSESQVLFSQVPNRLDHQSGANQQSEGQTELPHDKSVAQLQAAPGFSGARAFFQRVLQRNIRSAHGRRESEQHTRSHRDACCEKQYLPIDLKSCLADLRRHQRFKGAPGGLPDGQSQCSSGGGQEQAFRQQLPRDLSPRCTECDSHCHLAPSACRPRQQQIGHVRARNQQHEYRSHLKHQQAILRVAGKIFLQGHDGCPNSRICLRILSLQPRRNRVHFCLRLFSRYPRLQARHHIEKVIVALRPAFRSEIERHPVVHVFFAKEKSSGHDSQDFGLHIVQQNRPPDNGPVSPEPPLPQTVAEQDNLLFCLVFLRGEDTPNRRPRAEHIKKIGRESLPVELFRRTVACQAHGAALSCGHVCKHGVLRLPVQVIRRRRGVVRETDKGGVFPHHHEPMRLVVRQRPEQHRLHGAENGGIGADAQCERGNCYGEKSWILRNLAERIPQIIVEAHNDKDGQLCGMFRLNFTPERSGIGRVAWQEIA